MLALRDVTSRGSVAYDPAELVAGRRRAAASTTRRCSPPSAAGWRTSTSTSWPTPTRPRSTCSRLVAGGGEHLVAFADPDSSTFAFRGADPAGVAEFPRRFRTADGRARATGDAAPRRTGPVPGCCRDPPGGGAAARPGPAPRGCTGCRDAPRPATVEVRTFRSATSEAAYLAHRLREAHLLDGMPWSRMAVWCVHRAAAAVAAACAAPGRACRPSTQAEDLPLHLQPAVAPLLLLLRCALDERLDEEAAVALLHSPLGGADPLAERRLRQGLRALALGRRRPPALGRADRRGAARPGRAGRGRAAVGGAGADASAGCWRRPGRPPRGPAPPPRTCCGRCGGPPGWPTRSAPAAASAAGRRAGGAGGRPRPRRGDGRCSTRRPGSPTGCPARAPRSSSTTSLGQDLPADTLAPTADRGEAVRDAHRPRREGPGVGRRGGRRGAGGRLARPAAARQRARLRAAGRRARRPGGRRGRGGPGRADLGAAGRGAPAVLRRGHPGPASGCWSPRSLRRGRRRRTRSSRAGSSRAGRRRRPDPTDDRRRDSTPLSMPSRRAGADPAGAGGRAAYRRQRPGRRPTPGGRRRPPELARLAAAGVPGAAPGRLVGAARRSPTTGRWSTTGEPVRVTPSRWRARCGAACAGCWSGTAAARRPAPRRASATWCTPPRCSPRTPSADRGRCSTTSPTGSTRSSWPPAGWPAGAGPRRGDGRQAARAGWPRTRAGCSRSSTSSRCSLDDPDRPVELRGRVDRLEVDEDGRLVVIDLKTGKSSAVDGRDVAEHPQLGAYQAAVEAGRVRRVRRPSPAARRWCSSAPARKDAKEQSQPPLGEGRGGRLGAPRWCGVPRIRWPPPRSPRSPTPSAGSARCVRAARCPGRAARWSSRRPPAVRRRRDAARPVQQRDPCAPVADAGPRYTPVELAKLLRLPAPTPEQAAIIAAPVEPLLVVAGAGSGKTETMAARVVWLVANGVRAAGAGARADLHPQGRRRAGRTGCGPGSTSWCAGSGGGRDPLDDPLAGEPTVSTYHSYAGRIVTEHGLRAGLRAVHPAAHRGVPLAAGRRCWCATTTATCPGCDRMPSTVTDAVLALAGELDEHLVDAGRRWPRGPAGSSPRCRRAPGRVLRRRARGAATPAGPAGAAAAGARVRPAQGGPRGDGLRRPARAGGPGRPRPPGGRRDRAGPVPGGAARRVPGHQPRPGGAAAARCSAAGTR